MLGKYGGSRIGGESEDKKVKRSLRYSIIDGSFFNIMDGFTASFIAPFAIFLKASNTIISLLASFPDLFAAFFQLLSIKASEIFKSRKLVIAASALLQAVLWLPILFIPKIAPPEQQGLYLIVFVTALVALSSFYSPLWRSMMGDLVPEHERGGFFSKRNKITAAVCFVSTLSAGFILQHYSAVHPLVGFSILFGVAFVTRLISAMFIVMMYEKKAVVQPRFMKTTSKFTLRKFFSSLHKSEYGNFVVFICLFRIAVAIASPFFVVYELNDLHFTYLQLTIMSAVEIISSFALLSLWGKLNDEKGSRFVILITGLLIPLVPLGYLVSSNYLYLLFVTFISGAAWGGFNLAVGNFIFDASTSEDRVRYVAYFNLLHGLSVFIGASLGGVLLTLLYNNIKALFLVSGLARLAVAFFLFPALREMRIIQVSFDKKMFNYSLFIKPRQGFVEDPFDYYLAYEKRSHRPSPLAASKQWYSEPRYEDPYEEKKKQKVLYNNMLQTLVDNMNKKKPGP